MTDLTAAVFDCDPTNPRVTSPFDGHPCVVVLQITGSKEALVVPAFTAGRKSITSLIDSFVKDGISRDALSVVLDNAKAIKWRVNRDPVLAEWAVLQIDRVPMAALNTGKQIGTMNDDAFVQVVDAILLFSETTPGNNRFSAPILRRLRRLSEELHKRLGI